MTAPATTATILDAMPNETNPSEQEARQDSRQRSPRESPPKPAVSGPRALLRSPFFWAFVIGAVTLTLLRPFLIRRVEAPEVSGQAPVYRLIDRQGSAFGPADLDGQVSIVTLFDPLCADPCPELMKHLGLVQTQYVERRIEGVVLLSVSADPENTTPERLAELAETYGAESGRWELLTGSLEEVRALAEGIGLGPLNEGVEGLQEAARAQRQALVDGKGGLRGVYERHPTYVLDEVFHRAQHVLREQHREAR